MPVEQIQKPVYRTSDGKTFEDKIEAEIYEVQSHVDQNFGAFREASDYAQKAYQCVLTWELFKAGLLPSRKKNGAAAPPETPTLQPGDGAAGD